MAWHLRGRCQLGGAIIRVAIIRVWKSRLPATRHPRVSVERKERGVLPTDRSFVWRPGFPALTPHRRAGSCLTDPDHHSSGCNGTTRCMPCTTASGGSIATGLRPAPLWTGVGAVSQSADGRGLRRPWLNGDRSSLANPRPPGSIDTAGMHTSNYSSPRASVTISALRGPGLPPSPRRLDAHSCAPTLLGPSDRRSVRCVERTAGARLDQVALAHSARRPARAPARSRPCHHNS